MRAALLAAGVACAPAPPDDAPAPCADCALTDAHAYTYAAALSAEVVPVAAGVDVVVSWAGLQTDVHGHLRGADFEVEEARLIAFRGVEPQEVLDALAADRLTSAAIALYATCAPQGQACALSDFHLFGRTFELEEHFTEGSATWMVLLGSSAEPGGHAYVFLEPIEGEPRTEARVDDATSALEVSVDLAGLPPLVVAPEGGTTLSWAGVTRDGLGNPLVPHQLDHLVVGVYPRRSLEALESAVFDLEALADPLWQADVAGRHEVALGELAGDLSALDAAESALVAVYCTTCLNPAPKIVAVIEAP